MNGFIKITLCCASILCFSNCEIFMQTTVGNSETENIFNETYSYFSETDSICNEVYLDVPQLMQYPELPTGCESVSLTMALLYEGFILNKTTIADQYLIYNNETNNMALGYVGNPHFESGAGCFPPVIVKTANNFFSDQNVNYTATDVSGSSLEELFDFISDGIPVIVWSSIHMSEPSFTTEYSYLGKNTYEWYGEEHCVVLSGYNRNNHTIQVNDPLEGIVTRNMDEFEHIFNITGRNAVILAA